MSDEDLPPAPAVAGMLLVLVVLPALAYATYQYEALWADAALAGFGIGVVLILGAYLLERPADDGDDGVPDNPTELLEDGDSE